jgi:hypothetical protein
MCHKRCTTESGQELVECILLLFLVAVAVVVALALIGPAIGPTYRGAVDDAAAAIAGAQVDQSQSHGLFKHGTDAIDANNCFEKRGVSQTWFNPANGRTANICYDGPNFFVQIVDKLGYEITRFKKNGANCLGDVGRYLKSGGYVH